MNVVIVDNLRETHDKTQHWFPFLWQHINDLQKVIDEFEAKYPGRSDEVAERRKKLQELIYFKDACGGLLCDVQMILKEIKK